MGGSDPGILPNSFFEQVSNAATAEDLDPFGGAGPDIFGGSGPDNTSHYGKVQVQETKSGHVIMLDDTPGNEKILIKHNRGNGVELSKDGSVLIRARNNLSISVDANGVFIFEGDLLISSKNLKLDVTGDLELNVTGDMTLNVGGDKKENIGGSNRTYVTGNKGEIVEGSSSTTVLGSVTNTTLGAFSDNIKLDYRQTISGFSSVNVKGQNKVSSETEIAMSTPNMNLAAADISIFGATGTIGGEGIIMYNYNSYTGHTVTAGYTMDAPVGNFRRTNGTSSHYTTFHGSLDGNALTATQAGKSGTAGSIGAGGSAGAYSNVTADDVANDTTKSVDLPGPNQNILNEYLNASNRGIQKVSVDVGDFIKNKIIRYVKSGGIARKQLTTDQARAKLKDPNNAANSTFISSLIADGTISENYLKPVAPRTGRIYTPGKTAVAPTNHMRAGITTKSSKLIGGRRAKLNGYIPDPTYNPQSIDPRKGPFSITPKTLVGQGIPISTFLGSKGSITTMAHLATFDERQMLARHLLVQAEVVKIARNDNTKFANHRLIVAEGVYKPEPDELLAEGSPKFLAQTGRAITYELYNHMGKTNPGITFEFAEHIAENLSVYDEIRLDFDNLDPRGSIYGSNDLAAQITVILPNIPKSFNVTAKFGVKTVFNGKVQSSTDLIEIQNAK